MAIWARWLVVLAALGAGIFVALQSHARCERFGEFVQGSRIELRKVVWRDRDAPPTVQVAMLVFVVVALMTASSSGGLMRCLRYWLAG